MLSSAKVLTMHHGAMMALCTETTAGILTGTTWQFILYGSSDVNPDKARFFSTGVRVVGGREELESVITQYGAVDDGGPPQAYKCSTGRWFKLCTAYNKINLEQKFLVSPIEVFFCMAQRGDQKDIWLTRLPYLSCILHVNKGVSMEES